MIRRITVLGVVAALVWMVTLYLRIGREAGGDDLVKSDAIVVFGAAEYVGRPSPIFKSRLDHAAELWQQQWAPIIITTGGKAADRRFSEGGVGERYLHAHGIPAESIIAETQASDTRESARSVSRIMREHDLHSCVAVSDGYHLFRIKRMMQWEGIVVRGAPRRELHTAPEGTRVFTKLREAASYTAWLIQRYRKSE